MIRLMLSAFQSITPAQLYQIMSPSENFFKVLWAMQFLPSLLLSIVASPIYLVSQK